MYCNNSYYLYSFFTISFDLVYIIISIVQYSLLTNTLILEEEMKEEYDVSDTDRGIHWNVKV